MITNDVRCTHDVKIKTAMTKAAIKKKALFTGKFDCN